MTTKAESFILDNTRRVTPLLCPEIRLRLITDACPLWYATEADLARLPLADPYWGFCWAGGQALARFILDHPAEAEGKRVLDFGTGCGIGAVAAAMAGAAFVLGSDVDPMAVEAARLNAAANGVTLATTTEDLVGDPLAGIDVVLAGDMFYDSVFAAGVLTWLRSLSSRGLKVFLADPSRGHLAGSFLTKLAVYNAPADVDICGKHLQETTVYAVDDGRA